MDQRKRRLTGKERRKLIDTVKRTPILWDKTHPDRWKRNFLKYAWESVAHEMEIDVNVCKTGWKSVRDRERYYKNKATKSGGEPEYEYSSENSFIEPWEYSNELKFLEVDWEEDPTPSIFTYSADVMSTTPADDTSPVPSSSSYSYSTNTSTHHGEPMFNPMEIVKYKEEKINDNSQAQGITYSSDVMTTNLANNISPVPFATSKSYRCSSPTYNDQTSSCLNEAMYNVVELVEYKEKKKNDQPKPHGMADLMTNNSVELGCDRSKSSLSNRKSTNPIVLQKRKIPVESDINAFLYHLEFILNKISLRESERLQAKIMALAYETLTKQREQS